MTRAFAPPHDDRRLATGALGVAASLLVAACAPAPAVVDDRPPAVYTPVVATSSPYRGAAIARHTRLAAAAREAGDLAQAADHEEVLVLLSPNDPARRRALQNTREAIRRATRTHAEAGLAARRAGDLSSAKDSFLHVLALDPDNADAIKALREIDLAVMAKSQGDRAAKVRVVDDIVISAKARAADNTVDVEQRIEIMRAGDLNAGLRELRSWVDANPGERATRQRIGVAVADKARELEPKSRESALGLYEQAVTLAASPAPEWTTRIQALRKALGEHYYNEGMKFYRTDLTSAIRSFEAGARYDPSNTNLQLRLREAKLAQEKLRKIGK